MTLTEPGSIGSEMLSHSWNKTVSSLYRRHQFDLYVDKSQLWRCGGRMANSDFPSSTKNPIPLDKGHPLIALIVMDAHRRVMNNGVKETLTEIRSAYWLIRGRQFVRKVIHSWLTCRRLKGSHSRVYPHHLCLSIESDSVDHFATLAWTSLAHYMSKSLGFLEPERCGCAFTHVVLPELSTLI